MPRLLLRNDQFERIEAMLPGKPGDCGVTAKDNRLFVEAVLWIARVIFRRNGASGFRRNRATFCC